MPNSPLQGVPALNGGGIAAVLLRESGDRHLQRGNGLKLLILYLDLEVLAAVGHDGSDLRAFGLGSPDFPGQLRQRNGGELDIELLQQFTLIAHRGPEIKGAGTDLQNADAAEGLDNIAHRRKVPDAPLKRGILQTAVAKIGERHTEAAQHLAGGKQAALAVPQADAVFIRPLVPRPP